MKRKKGEDDEDFDVFGEETEEAAEFDGEEIGDEEGDLYDEDLEDDEFGEDDADFDEDFEEEDGFEGEEEDFDDLVDDDE